MSENSMPIGQRTQHLQAEEKQLGLPLRVTGGGKETNETAN